MKRSSILIFFHQNPPSYYLYGFWYFVAVVITKTEKVAMARESECILLIGYE